MLGVAAGVAVLTAVWKHFQPEIIKAREETDKLVESLNKAADARLGIAREAISMT